MAGGVDSGAGSTSITVKPRARKLRAICWAKQLPAVAIRSVGAMSNRLP